MICLAPEGPRKGAGGERRSASAATIMTTSLTRALLLLKTDPIGISWPAAIAGDSGQMEQRFGEDLMTSVGQALPDEWKRASRRC